MAMLPELDLRVMSQAEKKAQDRPKIMLSGFAGGNVRNLSQEIIQELINRKADELEINGTLELSSVIPTPKGAILRLLVDDQGAGRLKELDYTTSISSAGKVLFQTARDPNKATVTRSTEPESKEFGRIDECEDFSISNQTHDGLPEVSLVDKHCWRSNYWSAFHTMGIMSSNCYATLVSWIRPMSTGRGPRPIASTGNVLRMPGSLQTPGSVSCCEDVEQDIQRQNRDRLKWAFNSFDTDHSGTLCRTELRDVLRALGHNPTEDQADENESGALDMEEFLKFCDTQFPTCDPRSDLYPVFHLLDTQGRGLVKAGAIRSLMVNYPIDESSPLEADDILAEIQDEEVELSFEDFVELITGIPPWAKCPLQS
eukprot:maker-scaffold631_size122145-snap-gene-0.42 protein:Tk01068 transcript:maker-scaffold631_size122145-snap-gene-0.42-mRNA-1 annotation:"calmodulin"